jgi:hypothetical protein
MKTIFDLFILSIFWLIFFQAMAPQMQTPGEDLSTPKVGTLLRPSLGGQQHRNFSVDLWKSAFHDAFSRICPLRAAGHECGCLTVLPKLVCFEMGIISCLKIIMVFCCDVYS